MNIARVHLDALQALGYTEAEARFLYIVATHSGYFVARQFLAFSDAHWGKRTTNFWSKLHTSKHARTECFPKSGTIYHLFSRRLYRQIDRENIRNRRQHEIEFIQRRIGMLDFVLSHPQRNYLETESEKVSFFCNQLKVPNHFLPLKLYCGQKASQPTLRYFVDKFPMFLGDEPSSTVVTFTYLQGGEANLKGFAHHLEAYLPLFRQLTEFRFLYLCAIRFALREGQRTIQLSRHHPTRTQHIGRPLALLPNPESLGPPPVRVCDRRRSDFSQSGQEPIRRATLRALLTSRRGT
jgi:hypothetical protein